MENLLINKEPYKGLIPDGLPVPSSTIISGEGGSGKPLVGLQFVSSWLESGGSVLFVLTSMRKDFIISIMDRLYSTELGDYEDAIRYLKLNPGLQGGEVDEGEGLRAANLLVPEVWDRELSLAVTELSSGHPGTLVFGAALNLFLFSPTYADVIHKKFREAVESPGPESYLFTVATSAYREKIRELEESCDNLFYTYMEEMGSLDLELRKIAGKERERERISVPLTRESLVEIKEMAESGKRQLVPAIRKN
ncbi:hypothetical protein KGY64_03360 [Candidatus Bipolaricaulota bacterium]|nr:hypothetical protein [Candidatus Bipolaricaulota bacterium]